MNHRAPTTAAPRRGWLIGIVGAVVTLFEIVPMIVPVFPTERALKENFDEYGKPL